MIFETLKQVQGDRADYYLVFTKNKGERKLFCSFCHAELVSASLSLRLKTFTKTKVSNAGITQPKL